ncbi:MAG: hypothetical protein HYY06_22640 [Deltaproteobacteria bacterium]|nr:hypothetical protein [Deltaproteobacteria bacterium]
MTTLRDPREDPVETADGYDVRLARLHDEIDVLEDELRAGSARLALLRRQTEILERAMRGRRGPLRAA